VVILNILVSVLDNGSSLKSHNSLETLKRLSMEYNLLNMELFTDSLKIRKKEMFVNFKYLMIKILVHNIHI